MLYLRYDGQLCICQCIYRLRQQKWLVNWAGWPLGRPLSTKSVVLKCNLLHIANDTAFKQVIRLHYAKRAYNSQHITFLLQAAKAMQHSSFNFEDVHEGPKANHKIQDIRSPRYEAGISRIRLLRLEIICSNSLILASEFYLRNWWSLSWSTNFPSFMKVDLIAYSTEPAIGQPEPAVSNPHPHALVPF